MTRTCFAEYSEAAEDVEPFNFSVKKLEHSSDTAYARIPPSTVQMCTVSRSNISLITVGSIYPESPLMESPPQGS